MDELLTALETAFEEADYEVSETSANRDRVRVTILDDEASAEKLRSLTYDVVDESDVLGLNVTTESLDNDGVVTVVSFRYRG